MKSTRVKLFLQTEVSVFAVLCATAWLLSMQPAHAQWVWTDANGTKQFSDRAPPNDVPKANIIRTPQGLVIKERTYSDPTAPKASAPEGSVAAAAPASAPASAPAKPASKPLTPEEAFQKRQKDQAAAAAKADKEAAAAAKKEADCTRAQNYQRSLASGERVGTTDARGNRTLLDDAGRAAETKRAEAAIAAACK
jgi:hypothetical protein